VWGTMGAHSLPVAGEERKSTEKRNWVGKKKSNKRGGGRREGAEKKQRLKEEQKKEDGNH